MSLQEKYAALIEKAKSLQIKDLAVKEENNVLYINGEASTGQQKDELWNIYNKIDPDFRSSDLILNITVSASAPHSEYKVTTHSSNLNIRKGPGTDQPIIGKAAHDSTVILLSKYNNEWYLIKNADGIEGYCNAEYLTMK